MIESFEEFNKLQNKNANFIMLNTKNDKSIKPVDIPDTDKFKIKYCNEY